MGGAISLIASPAIWRECTRHLEPNLGLMAALLASCVHRSPNATVNITNSFVLFFLRFLRPAGIDARQVGCTSVKYPLAVDSTDTRFPTTLTALG